jgi:NADPH:quinone reductase-like Zn-dependent oxidoreductase
MHTRKTVVHARHIFKSPSRDDSQSTGTKTRVSVTSYSANNGFFSGQMKNPSSMKDMSSLVILNEDKTSREERCHEQEKPILQYPNRVKQRKNIRGGSNSIIDMSGKGRLCQPVSVRKKRNSAVCYDSAADDYLNSQDRPSLEILETTCLDFFDDFLLSSFFRGVPAWPERRRDHGKQITVKVLVSLQARPVHTLQNFVTQLVLNEPLQATTVPYKPQFSESRDDLEDQLYESFFVGTVHKFDPRSSENTVGKGAMVTSLQKCAIRSQFVTMDSESLIVLSEKFDAGEAACIVSTYLPAFEFLHHGSMKRANRFSPESLKGQQVLITDGEHAEAQAVAKLALLGGAATVFLVNPGPLVETGLNGKNNVVVLGGSHEDWLPVVRGSMDVVVDYCYPNHSEEVMASLTERGRLVCKLSTIASKRSHGWMSELDHLYEQSTLYLMSKASIFDFAEMCENNVGQLEVSFQAPLF